MTRLVNHPAKHLRQLAFGLMILGVAGCGLAENEEVERFRGKQDYGNGLPFSYGELVAAYPAYGSYSDEAVWSSLGQGNYGATCATRMSIAFNCAAGGAYKITSSDKGYVFGANNGSCGVQGGIVSNAFYFGEMLRKRYGEGSSYPTGPGVVVGVNPCYPDRSTSGSAACNGMSREWSGHVALWNGYGCDGGSCYTNNSHWTFTYWPAAGSSGGSGGAQSAAQVGCGDQCRLEFGSIPGNCSGPGGVCTNGQTCGTSIDCCPCKCDIAGDGNLTDVAAGHKCGGDAVQEPAPVQPASTATATPDPPSSTPNCQQDQQCRQDHGNTPGGYCPRNVCGLNQQCGTSVDCCPCGCDPDGDGVKNYEVDAGHICGGLDDPNAPAANVVVTPEPPPTTAPETVTESAPVMPTSTPEPPVSTPPPTGNNCDVNGVCDCGEGLYCYYGRPIQTSDANSNPTFCRAGAILWWCCPQGYWVENAIPDSASNIPSCALKPAP